MNQLVTINNNQAVVSSRQIADHFQKEHKNVLQNIESILSTSAEISANLFYASTAPDSYGREQKIYLMNRDGFTLLAMSFTGKKALDWKLKYINAFNEMEQALKENNNKVSLIDSLRQAADKLESQQQYISENKDKIEFAGKLLSDNTSILIGDFSTLCRQNNIIYLMFSGPRDYKKLGRNNLFEWLRYKGFLKREPKNMPFDRYLDYFEVRTNVIELENGDTRENFTTLITAQGQAAFLSMLKEENIRVQAYLMALKNNTQDNSLAIALYEHQLRKEAAND